MVEIKVNKEECNAVVTGDVTTIVAELAVAIGNIYQSIKATQGEGVADVLRVGMLIAMDPASPAWQPAQGMVVINKKTSGTPTDQS